jgi:sulfur carrier protein ThiS adenylyltransferase
MNFEKIRKLLSDKTVGIAGCGGLGSNCAVALARTGIGKLIIADFDIIEESNLNRQFYFFDQAGQIKSYTLSDNLYLVNPGMEVIPHNIRLNAENIDEMFKDCGETV